MPVGFSTLPCGDSAGGGGDGTGAGLGADKRRRAAVDSFFCEEEASIRTNSNNSVNLYFSRFQLREVDRPRVYNAYPLCVFCSWTLSLNLRFWFRRELRRLAISFFTYSKECYHLDASINCGTSTWCFVRGHAERERVTV